MKTFIFPLLIIAFILTSCKKVTEENTNSKNIIPFTQISAPVQNKPLQPQQNNSIMNQNGVNQNSIPQVQTTAAPVVVAKGMNPSHGQPGHRCDIAVGAPLSSPAATTQQVVTKKNTPTSSTTGIDPPITTVAPPTPEGMNPPHGQNKHRCDIAVGAPLPKE